MCVERYKVCVYREKEGWRERVCRKRLRERECVCVEILRERVCKEKEIERLYFIVRIFVRYVCRL